MLAFLCQLVSGQTEQSLANSLIDWDVGAAKMTATMAAVGLVLTHCGCREKRQRKCRLNCRLASFLKERIVWVCNSQNETLQALQAVIRPASTQCQ